MKLIGKIMGGCFHRRVMSLLLV